MFRRIIQSWLFFRELEFLPSVDDVGFQVVEFDDLGITAAVAEMFPGDLPQRIAVNDGVDAGRGINRFAGCVKNAVAGVGVGAGLRVGEDLEGAFLRFGIRPGFPHTVERFGGTAGSTATGGIAGRAALQLCRDLGGEVTHAVHHPRAGAGGGREPAVDGQEHLVGFRGVIQRFRFVAKPQKFALAVALADIDAEFDQLFVNDVAERIGLRGVGGALDGDRPLIVLARGRAPGAVLLVHVQTDAAGFVDAVVSGDVAGAVEHLSEGFSGTLADHAVGRDAVDRMGALPGIMRAAFGVNHQRAVGIAHFSSSFPFLSCL